MRPDNVADGGPNEQEAGRALPLGVTGGVLRRPRIDQRRDTRVEGDDVVAEQQDPAIAVSVRYCIENRTPGNGWKAQKYQYRAFLLDPIGKEGTTQGRDQLHSTEWNVEEDGVETVEPEGFDDQWTKCGNATARYADD